MPVGGMAAGVLTVGYSGPWMIVSPLIGNLMHSIGAYGFISVVCGCSGLALLLFIITTNVALTYYKQGTTYRAIAHVMLDEPIHNYGSIHIEDT